MASKSKRRRRVLGASCILAALIIAGSSFAWFTSKDEVTNRLSATANYGVTIAEDFEPPANWLPGQEINKDVSVVNTGNVDAFVRTWIDGEMSVVAKSAWDDSTDADNNDATAPATLTNFSSGLTKTADTQTKLTGVNLNWYNTTTPTKYYKELSQVKSENPLNSSTSNTAANETTNTPGRFSEVQAVQAGGVLVYHQVDSSNPATTAGAEYYYVLEQATTITGKKVTAGTPAADVTTETYPAGTIVATANSCNKSAAGVIIAYDYYGDIDTSQFYPETEGLYIFRRSVKLDAVANTADDYEYTGYYFFKDAGKNTTTATAKADDIDTLDVRPRTGTGSYNPVYLALCYDTSHTQRSDYVLPDGKVTTNVSTPTNDEVLPVSLADVKLYTATEKILSSYNTATPANNLKWTFTPAGDLVTYTLNYVNETDATDNGSVVTTGTDIGTVTIGSTQYWVKQNKLYASEAHATAGTPEATVTGYTVTTTQVAGTGTAGSGILSASYGDGDSLIKVNVHLTNLNNAPAAGTAETWSVIENKAGDDQKWTFYYNNDVEEGATTTKLVDYVELDEAVTDEAYLAFDFDLNVFMESIQVVLNENGVESGTGVVDAWAKASTGNTNYNAATATTNVTDNEITYITWAK